MENGVRLAPDVHGHRKEGRYDRGRRPRRVSGRSGCEEARLAYPVGASVSSVLIRFMLDLSSP